MSPRRGAVEVGERHNDAMYQEDDFGFIHSVD